MEEVRSAPGLPLPLALLTGGLAFLGLISLFSMAVGEPLDERDEPESERGPLADAAESDGQSAR